MINKYLLIPVLILLTLVASCGQDEIYNEVDSASNTHEIYFSLNNIRGSLVAEKVSSLVGMNWKILCFDDDYNYLFEKTGVIDTEDIKVPVSKEHKIYRIIFFCANTKGELPTLNDEEVYWDMKLFSPKLPLDDPLGLLVSQGGEDGTLRISTSTSHVSIALAPRAAKIMINDKTKLDAKVNSITFSNAIKSVPYFNIDPQYYDNYSKLEVIDRTEYVYTMKDESCYILPDLCRNKLGMSAKIRVTDAALNSLVIPVMLPSGFALNMNSGKVYYIDITEDTDGKLQAVWATKPVTKKLVVATQNFWGKSASVAIDHFKKFDVDVMCGQECGAMSDAEIVAEGLYVHTHTNNGQGACKIISRYPFVGITPNKYGVYIDLGDNVTALVMNCHAAHKPYGPYQLNNIEYGGFPGTADVDYVVEVNEKARIDMVNKITEDYNSSTTSFVSLSGDFNEPSWLDWTNETVAAKKTPYAVQWPTTYRLSKNGLNGDAYRTIHPDPVMYPGYTWTPFPGNKEVLDRIDLTLYPVSPNIEVVKSEILGEDGKTSDIVFSPWLLDHRGLRTVFTYVK